MEKSINQAISKSTRRISPEPEKAKYAQLRIVEKGEQTTNLPPAGSETSSSRRRSDRVSKPVERFDDAQFKTPSIVSKAPSLRGRAKSTLKDMKSILQESWKERPAPTSEGSKSKECFKRKFDLNKNKGSIPGKTAHREYKK